MECRCYRGGSGRTKMKVMKFSARDFVALGVVVIFIAVIIVINHFVPDII